MNCMWLLPPWKMKRALKDPTQKLSPIESNEPKEMFVQEMESAKYIKITPFSHPKLFIHLLGKANSISSDQTFSHTCNAKIKGSICTTSNIKML